MENYKVLDQIGQGKNKKLQCSLTITLISFYNLLTSLFWTFRQLWKSYKGAPHSERPWNGLESDQLWWNEWERALAALQRGQDPERDKGRLHRSLLWQIRRQRKHFNLSGDGVLLRWWPCKTDIEGPGAGGWKSPIHRRGLYLAHFHPSRTCTVWMSSP